jgi:hypothetical protein
MDRVPPGLGGGRQHPFDSERGDSRVLGVNVVDQEIEDDKAAWLTADHADRCIDPRSGIARS